MIARVSYQNAGLRKNINGDLLKQREEVALSDHPEVTNGSQGWFARRVAEVKEMGKIK